MDPHDFESWPPVFHGAKRRLMPCHAHVPTAIAAMLVYAKVHETGVRALFRSSDGGITETIIVDPLDTIEDLKTWYPWAWE